MAKRIYASPEEWQVEEVLHELSLQYPKMYFGIDVVTSTVRKRYGINTDSRYVRAVADRLDDEGRIEKIAAIGGFLRGSKKHWYYRAREG